MGQYKRYSEKLLKMVIRTRNCDFCEYQIYPGRGIVFVARDSSSHLYINKKSMNFDRNKTKSHMIRWTVAWRRKNKKLQVTDAKKKRRRRRKKVQRAISGGMTVEKIVQMQNDYRGRNSGNSNVQKVKKRNRNKNKNRFAGGRGMKST